MHTKCVSRVACDRTCQACLRKSRKRWRWSRYPRRAFWVQSWKKWIFWQTETCSGMHQSTSAPAAGPLHLALAASLSSHRYLTASLNANCYDRERGTLWSKSIRSDLEAALRLMGNRSKARVDERMPESAGECFGTILECSIASEFPLFEPLKYSNIHLQKGSA